MNKSANSEGYVFDHPSKGALEGRAGHALPPGLSQSLTLRDGIGRRPCPSCPDGSFSNPHYFSNKKQAAAARKSRPPQIKKNFPKVEPSDSSYYVHYTANLSSIDERLFNDTTKCIPKYLVLQCDCGRHAVAKTCMKNKCISCRPYTGMKRARAVMKRFVSVSWKHNDHLYFPKIVYTVFTLPMELREHALDPKYIHVLRFRAWQILKQVFGAEWAVEATHPISEKHPDTFHPHLNFLWRPKHGHPTFIDVAKLRTFWQIVLNYYGPVDVWSNYFNKPAQLWKKAKYVTRVFPEFSTWQGNVKWYGKTPKLQKKEECLCPVCHQKIMALGYARPHLVAQLLEHDPKSGRPPPDILLYDIDLFIDF